MRVVIGDIHGCFYELQRLLDLIGPGKDDELIPLGDLVDGGPDSPAVVQFFMQRKNAKPIRGNHERDHIWQAGLPPACRNLSRTKQRTREKFKEEYRKGKISVTYEDAVDYFKTFPKYMNLPEAILVHAGIAYGVPFDKQEKTLLGCGSPKNGSNGNGTSKHGGLPMWAHYYPNDEKPILFGHRSIAMENNAQWPLPQRQNLWPLDTKCVCGGYLTAVTLPDFTVYRVRSAQGT